MSHVQSFYPSICRCTQGHSVSICLLGLCNSDGVNPREGFGVLLCSASYMGCGLQDLFLSWFSGFYAEVWETEYLYVFVCGLVEAIEAITRHHRKPAHLYLASVSSLCPLLSAKPSQLASWSRPRIDVWRPKRTCHNFESEESIICPWKNIAVFPKIKQVCVCDMHAAQLSNCIKWLCSLAIHSVTNQTRNYMLLTKRRL